MIPLRNINGAATATCVAMVFFNLLISVSLYKRSGIYFFTLDYMKPFICIFVLAFLAYCLVNLESAKESAKGSPIRRLLSSENNFPQQKIADFLHYQTK